MSKEYTYEITKTERSRVTFRADDQEEADEIAHDIFMGYHDGDYDIEILDEDGDVEYVGQDDGEIDMDDDS